MLKCVVEDTFFGRVMKEYVTNPLLNPRGSTPSTAGVLMSEVTLQVLKWCAHEPFCSVTCMVAQACRELSCWRGKRGVTVLVRRHASCNDLLGSEHSHVLGGGIPR